jgi:uncharacterized surface anchored protein
VPPTNTPVPPTATATNTPVPPTATAVPLGALRIYKVDAANPNKLLAGACFNIWDSSGAYNTIVCDNDPIDPDADPTGGIIRLNDLQPGDYTVLETDAPGGYVKDSNAYTVTVYGGELSSVTVYNAKEANPQGSTVYIIKLNCADMPQNVTAQMVFNGAEIEGCVRAPAGVEFDVKDPSGNYLYTNVETDDAGFLEIWVPFGIDTIILEEDTTTNPTVKSNAGPFTLDDVHGCPCRYTNRVIVNILKS